MEASCIAGKEGGVGVYSPELERKRERENSDLLNSMPLFQKRAPWTLLFFPFFIKNFARFFSFKGPELSSGKSQQPSFFFFFFF